MINRKIWTIWLNDDPIIPPLIQKCIDSQKIPGYEHELITLKNVFPEDEYLKKCIEKKDWVRASDFLRLNILLFEGGIYLDADLEILPGKNFDDMLDNTVFISTEPTNFMLANTVIGAIPMSGFINDVINTMILENKENVFEAGMGIFHEIAYNDLVAKDKFSEPERKYGIKVYSSEYFQPYNNQTGETNITENTRCVHYNTQSWKEFPLISIIVPTLRPEGLKRLLKSIDFLNYPKDKLEVLIQEDIPRLWVPKRVNELFARSKGKYIVYAADDMEFDPQCLMNAYRRFCNTPQVWIGCLSLVSFNAWPLYPDEWNICEHFMIERNFVEVVLKWKIFDEDFHHAGVDNLLFSKAKAAPNKYYGWPGAVREENAKIVHHHFSKWASMDEVYETAYANVAQDRDTLKKKLDSLNSNLWES